MALVNPFTAPGKWYKANLHTHTTTSDGRASPAETAELYRQAGYDVLAITDHRKTNDVSGLSRKGFLVVSGMEYHPELAGVEGRPHHLVAINVPHGFDLEKPQFKDANACIRAVAAAGGVSILAHPLWCGHRYDQYSYLQDYVALEVYNNTCDKIGRSAGDGDYCHLLDEGRYMPAVAVDDTHSPVDRFGGWTWLKLRSLTPEAVTDALRQGLCYASTGPRIGQFRVRGGNVEVTCTDAEFIYLSAWAWHGARRMAEAGKSIRKFVCPIGKDWRYVRAVVVDHRGRKAWTPPIVL